MLSTDVLGRAHGGSFNDSSFKHVQEVNMANDDYVEGPPEWWWKYVFPTGERFWLTVAASLVLEPDPHPWRRRVTGEVLEGVVMLHAAARADQTAGERLTTEAVAKIHQALAGITRAELESR